MVETVRDTIGLRIVLDCDEDISTQTDLRVYYKTPSGTVAYWDGVLGTDELIVDGVTYEANTYMYYITVADDLDEVGDWQLQGYVVMTGFTGYGSDMDRNPWANMYVKDYLSA